MSLSRRDLLSLMLTAAAAPLAASAASAPAAATTPWRNWSGALQSRPRARLAPGSEEELVALMRGRSGPLRPVGSGHSFSPLVPTDGDLLVLDRLAGVLEADATQRTAWVAAGTRLSDLGPALERVGQACPNMPDIDRQTLAGALATATHGTGRFRSLSGYVDAMRLVTPSGAVLELEAGDPRLDAARVGLGALGVVTAARLRNVAPLRLRALSAPEPLERVLAEFDERVRTHRHFEFFPLPHCDQVFSLSIDPSDEPIHNPQPTPEEEAELFGLLRMLMDTPLIARRPLANEIVEGLEPEVAVDTSYRILCNIRNQRFNEMEYSVPAAVGMACVREVMDTITDSGIDVAFPLEVRYVDGDEAWLSMFEGGPRVSISIHEFADRDHRPYFDLIEPIFLRHGGRPHWGKVHGLERDALQERYPRLDDFRRLRAELDPDGRLLNDHLRRILGA